MHEKESEVVNISSSERLVSALGAARAPPSDEYRGFGSSEEEPHQNRTST